MPNRTIYVADADVPLFEKAQSLVGGNLSAAIAEALRRFVREREQQVSGFEEVTVKLGKNVHSYKRFQGRRLASGRMLEEDGTREVSYRIYQTPKNNLAVYVSNTPNWNYWTDRKKRPGKNTPVNWDSEEWSDVDWSRWSGNDSEYRLEIFASLEELEHNVPDELYETVARILRGNNDKGVEVLDI
ncbi:EXLDI protein [Ktedonosporobacter rubrisoli]|uniref:EXLDI protein n=1 Tax=Ktedonosporobacter rubrisoli TaxID=2509675 RepID=A0A4P6JYQ6_KTERU|nr:EXLDI protein [Ktedonosporobacter rubrisoli]QBD80590.1 EXLDI protein [Ktedonosporobacter rubrisoli]